MPVLEDGLSSGHASDTENNNPTVLLMKRQISEIEQEIVVQRSHHGKLDEETITGGAGTLSEQALSGCPSTCTTTTTPSPLNTGGGSNKKDILDPGDIDLTSLDPLNGSVSLTGDPISEGGMEGQGEDGAGEPPPPAPTPHRGGAVDQQCVEAALKDIRLTLQRTKTLPLRRPPSLSSPPLASGSTGGSIGGGSSSPGGEDEGESAAPVWVPRKPGGSGPSADEDDADTDLETDRLLGQQRTNDEGYFDDKLAWRKPKSRTYPDQSASSKVALPPFATPTTSSSCTPLTLTKPAQSSPPDPLGGLGSALPAASTNGKLKKDKDGTGKKKGRNKEVLIEGVLFRARYLGSTQLVCEGQPTKSTRMMQAEEAVSRIKVDGHHVGCTQDVSPPGCGSEVDTGLGPGKLFRLKFLGSVQVEEEDPTCCKRRLKKQMVEEAVLKVKAPEGETQPSTEVDLFISTEKIMVLNTDLKEIMMDHALRTISYIADIGELVVLMARRRFVSQEPDEPPKISRTPKMICHVFESEEAQFIAQSIGQAFQVAYMEFLKANGIEDHSFVKEMDYQEVLNSQEIFGDELQMFAKKELQKEVVVPKAKGEILGVVIVESGWGSMLPTVVIANLAPAGAAARCGHLNIGDQIIAVNGVSLVGLPLSTCQTYIKNSKNQTVVKLTVVPCAPVVEVKIKRPDTKYQLGFSVQNGVICSLLRGGIAERGGVRVGHRIIEINNQSVVAVPHEKIVNLLATSVGEILMKTMPTSMFRLLTGQETPVFI
uniref:Protein lin-10 n=1 Tax=Cacopsylla melanoneura TaxID=428564 RepID=A0A8D9F9V2_9HEMI